MTPGISEHRSEIRRGRPASRTLEEKLAGSTFHELKTSRGRQNRGLAMNAMRALKDEPASWFWPGYAAVMAGGASVSFTIMEALSRAGVTDEGIREVARQLAALPRMNATEVRATLRRYRGTWKLEPTDDQVLAVVCGAVDRCRHRGATIEQLARALDLARAVVSEEQTGRSAA